MQVSAVPVLEYLIQNGANIDAPDLHGRAALHYAAIFDRLEAAQRLLRHRATRYSVVLLNHMHVRLTGQMQPGSPAAKQTLSLQPEAELTAGISMSNPAASHLSLLMSMSAQRQPSQDPALTPLCDRGAKDVAGRTAFNMAVLCGSGVGLLSTLAEEPARPVRPPLNNRPAPSY